MKRVGVRVAAMVIAVTALVMDLTVSAADDPPKKIDVPLRPLAVRSLAFSPDGRRLVAGAGAKDQRGVVVAWDVAGRKPLWQRSGPTGFSSVSFSPDGKELALAQGKPTALRLDLETGQELGVVGPHPAVVRAAAYIPGTNLLATGSDGTIRLWDLKSNTVQKELKGHPAEVQSLVVSPNGKWLVSTGPDTTRVWDVAAGKELPGVIKQSRGTGYYGIIFVAPDRVLMSNNSGAYQLRELPSGKVLLRFENDGGYEGTAFSEAAGLAAYHWPSGTEIAIADLTFRNPTPVEQARIDKLFKDFDDDSYAVREAASKAMRKIGSVAEPALHRAMEQGPSPEVRMRAREARKVILSEPLRTLSGHVGNIGPMVFSPDGKTLATGAADGTVRLWDPLTGRELARLDLVEPPAK